MSNWSYSTPMNIGQPGAPVRANGGGGWQALNFRNAQDAMRTPMGQRVPSSEYPDGYLGTINSRREDRLLDSLKNRLTQRSYQRGVHKGEAIDQADYYWPDELRPTVALEYQAQGLKWTQRGNPVERLVNGGKNAITSPEDMAAVQQQYGLKNPGIQPIDPHRAERLRKMMPGWR